MAATTDLRLILLGAPLCLLTGAPGPLYIHQHGVALLALADALALLAPAPLYLCAYLMR